MDDAIRSLRGAAQAHAHKLSGFDEAGLCEAARTGATVIVLVEATASPDLGAESVLLFKDDAQQAWAVPADLARITEWLSMTSVLAICPNELPDVKLMQEPC